MHTNESGSRGTIAAAPVTLPALTMTGPKVIWWIPLAIYSAGRGVSALLMWWFSRYQGATNLQSEDRPFDYFVYHPRPANPGYFGFSTNWDGQWYEYIATDGYQSSSSNSSNVANNAWNFPPLFPYSVRSLMQVSGWDFAVCSAVFSTVVGAVAMVMIFHVVRNRGGVRVATSVTLLSSFYIASPLFQIAYSESLGLLLVAGALLLIQRCRYGWALVPVVLLCFTRLISPPLALVVLIHVYWRHRTGAVPVSGTEWLKAAILGVVAVAGIGIWPLLSQGLRGGDQADRATAMVSGYRGGWFGELWSVSPGLVVIPLTIVVVVIIGSRRAWLQCGVVVGAWAAAYPLFLLASTPPLTGIIRYFLFAFPLAILLVPSDDRSRRTQRLALFVATAMMLVLQALWVRYSFVVDLGASHHIMP